MLLTPETAAGDPTASGLFMSGPPYAEMHKLMGVSSSPRRVPLTPTALGETYGTGAITSPQRWWLARQRPPGQRAPGAVAPFGRAVLRVSRVTTGRPVSERFPRCLSDKPFRILCGVSWRFGAEQHS